MSGKGSSKPKKSRAIIEDDDDDEDEQPKPKSAPPPSTKKDTKKSKKIVDEDEEEDEDEEGEDLEESEDDDDEEEEEEEEVNPEEFNDFIDDGGDAVEEEEGASVSGASSGGDDQGPTGKKKKKKEKKKKKKRKHRKESGEGGGSEKATDEDNDDEDESDKSMSGDELSDLEDEDLDLLKDNLKVKNLEDIGISTKRKRIRKLDESSSGSETETVPKKVSKQATSSKDKKKSGGEAAATSKKSSSSTKTGSHDEEKADEDEEESAGENMEEAEEGGEEGEGGGDEDEAGSDAGSFIVDDSDDERPKSSSGNARHSEQAAKSKKKAGYTDEAQQEALEIFGVNAEELGAMSSDEDKDERDEDEDEEEFLEDEEDLDEEIDEDDEEGDFQREARKRQRQRQRKTLHKIEDIFEPQELEKNLLTEHDQQIRIEDKPERFMLRTVPVTSEPDEYELEREAEWIFRHAFQMPTITAQVSNQDIMTMTSKPESTIGKIKEVLNFIRNEFFEVPFIAAYRKEYLQQDLGSVDDLWKVYEMDEQYCQLKARKENLIKLVKRMQKYQATQLEEIQADTSLDSQSDTTLKARLIEMLRPITDADIDRIRAAPTNADFLDCSHHFHLHYGGDLTAMREFEARLNAATASAAANSAAKKTKKKKKKKKKKTKKTNIDGEEEEEEDEDDVEAGDDDDEGEDEDGDEEEEDEEEEVPEADIPNIESNKLTKYASKKDRFHYCKLAGLTSLTKKFGLSAEQLGENLECDYQKHEVEQWTGGEPLVVAMDYIKEPYFQNVDQVLQTVRYMISMEMSREPAIRSHVRELYFQRACITVRPTVPRGLNEIDENHPCFTQKYLYQKPCTELKRDEFLKLVQAEQDGQLVIKFDLTTGSSTSSTDQTAQPPPSSQQAPAASQQQPAKPKATDDDDWDDDNADSSSKSVATVPPTTTTPSTTTTTAPLKTSTFRTINDKLKSFYQKDEFSYSAEQWNALRAKVIDDLLEKFLFVEMEKELRSKLVQEAKEYVFKECCTSLRAMLQTAPYEPPSISPDDDDETGLRVLAICYTTLETQEDDPQDPLQAIDSYSVCTCVSGDGTLNEFITFRKLTAKLNSERGESIEATENTPDLLAHMHPDKRAKLEDLKRLEEFIERKRPHLIVVAAESKDAHTIMDDVTDLLKRITQRTPAIGQVGLELVENEVGRLIAVSKLCQADFGNGNLPSLVKQAITLARFMQDPLLTISQLFNHDRDILSLKLHPMQQTIIAASGTRNSEDCERLRRMLEIEFVNTTNDVGVDLNRCNQQSHTANVLQFVAGLGARKAQHILRVLRHERLELKSKLLPEEKSLATYPVVKNRLSLVTKCSLGRRVFINCAGFIKFDVDRIAKEIDEDEHAQDSQSNNDDEANYTEILDSTRIHPETYEWARKMAVDALDFDEENVENPSMTAAVKEILENPKRLKDLDLDAFAAELLRTGNGDKATTLYNIRHELSSRYRDLRTKFKPMSDERRFYVLLKETPETFYRGKLVTCRVVGIARRRPNKEQLDEANPLKDENTCMWICSFCKRADFNELSKVWSHFDNGECPGPPIGVRVLLDNQCQGFVALRFLSDTPVTNPDERIKHGQIIHARIQKIDFEKYRCDLTTRTSDLRDVENEWRLPRDRYYDFTAEEEDKRRVDEKRKKMEHTKTYTKRVIAHPQFKNVAYQQAIDLLKGDDVEIGETIIRPSSKGPDHLTVTWKVYHNCFQHVDVLEEKKMNAFSIGKRLIIEGEDFEDLDEILARYISPMVSLVKEIISHKNFKSEAQLEALLSQQDPENQRSHPTNGGVRLELVERYLLEERTKNPSKIPYIFLCYTQTPGRFMIAYMIKLKVRYEFISITYEAYRFRQKMFRTFNELIAWFKLHYNDPLPQNSNSSSSMVAQMSAMSVTQRQQQPPLPTQPPPPLPSQNASRGYDSSSTQSKQYDDFLQNSGGSQNNNMSGAKTPGYSTSTNANADDDWNDEPGDSSVNRSYAPPAPPPSSNYASNNHRGGGEGGYRGGGRGGGSSYNNNNNRDSGGGGGGYRDSQESSNYRGGGRGGYNNGGGSFRGGRGGRGGGFGGRDSGGESFGRSEGRGEGGRDRDGGSFNNNSNNSRVVPAGDDDWDEGPSSSSSSFQGNNNTRGGGGGGGSGSSGGGVGGFSGSERGGINSSNNSTDTTVTKATRTSRFSAANDNNDDWNDEPSSSVAQPTPQSRNGYGGGGADRGGASNNSFSSRGGGNNYNRDENGENGSYRGGGGGGSYRGRGSFNRDQDGGGFRGRGRGGGFNSGESYRGGRGGGGGGGMGYNRDSGGGYNREGGGGYNRDSRGGGVFSRGGGGGRDYSNKTPSYANSQTPAHSTESSTSVSAANTPAVPVAQPPPVAPRISNDEEMWD